MKKTISKLKLTQLSKADLEARQMNMLRGGVRSCTCSCEGTSSAATNRSSNYNSGASGYSSTSGCNQYAEIGETAGGSTVTGYCSSCNESSTGTYYP